MQWNSELEEKLSLANSEEEALAILAEAGIEITPEQLTALEAADSELNETSLDQISAGSIVYALRKFLERFRPAGGGGTSSGGGAGRRF